MTFPRLLASPHATEDVRMLSTEPCAACGQENTTEAAECRACGASLVLQFAPTSRGERRRPSSDSFWSAEGDPPDEETLDYSPGEIFAGRYVIIDRLGQGGMGVVYKARDRELNRNVALKMIRSKLEGDREALERFRREPGLAQQVTHPNVCRVHDLGVHESVRYLSMEYLDADTLSELVDKIGALSLRQTLELGIQICRALEAIHERGIIHRDLKPSNIAVDRSQRVVVMDFGLARGPIDSEVTRPGVLVGSYAYLAPEHIRGEPLTDSADIYALGLVLYEMLTGRRPPGDEDQRPLALRGESAVCPPPSAHAPDAPKVLDAVVMRCLAWERAERPPVAEIRQTLEELARDEQVRVAPRRRRRSRSSSRIGRVAVMSALAAIAVLVYVLSRTSAVPTGDDAVAVLSFTLESASAEDAYLSELAEDAIAASLRAAPAVVVKPVEPELRDEPAPKVARALDARFLLDGTIARRGNDISIEPRLRDAEGQLVWTDSFNGTDLVDVLTRVRARLLERFGADVSAVASLEELRTSNLDAYRRFLEARTHHEGWYAEEGRDDARRLYQQALELDPGFAAAHAGQAVASLGSFLESGDETDLTIARFSSRRALSFGERLPEAHVAAGTVLAGEGRWDEASAALRRGLDLAPGDDALRRNLADLYETLGRPEEAKALYEEAIAAAPGYWMNYYWYGGFLYRTGNLDTAPVHLRRAVELEPEAASPITLLGFHALSTGDLQEAEDRFARALELTGDYDSRQRLGLVHYYAGELESALEQWRHVLDAAPDQPGAQMNLADALRQLGRSDEANPHYSRALDQFERALSAMPNDDESRMKRAQILAALDRCGEAREAAESVLSARPENTDFLYYGAVTAARCGFDAWAEELTLRAIGAGNVVGIRFDPDLAPIRELNRVSRALELIGLGE